MNEAQKRYRDAMPQKYRGLYDRAVDGTSRKAVIRCFCLSCCGWSEKETSLCTVPGCPLFKYRRKG
jgi:hypothetical protein